MDNLKELGKYLKLTEEELSWKENPIGVPFRITSHFLSLIDPEDPKDPLRRQVVPTSKENLESFYEDKDPLAEVRHSHGERLIHRYSNRVAFLATDLCPMYCRHCFRRRFTGNLLGPATKKEIDNAASYLKDHKEVLEILITGGDPLTLSNEELDLLIGTFRAARPNLIIRICTRYLASNPKRITKELISIFKKYDTAPFYLLTQFNHPREITKESIEAVNLFVNNGIPALNQTVLLRDVNDNVDTLVELCNTLLFNKIKPYYLFQGDLVSGTSSFRVPLQRGMEIERELRKKLSGLAMPNYTADLPEGGGKVPLCGSYIIEEPKEENGQKKGSWKFRTPEGETRYYIDPTN
ncbi:MAG: KamA family radical SAM protein [Sphaerochaetaceae bacterium]|nr:KamA family radical SAM protein [Sphaerochaetaceae bacterium]